MMGGHGYGSVYLVSPPPPSGVVHMYGNNEGYVCIYSAIHFCAVNGKGGRMQGSNNK